MHACKRIYKKRATPKQYAVNALHAQYTHCAVHCCTVVMCNIMPMRPQNSNETDAMFVARSALFATKLALAVVA